MVRLENWAVVSRPSSPYDPPELWKLSLHGNVFGHERFSNGKEVTTSTIIKSDNGMIVTKSGTHYELGKVDPDYEKLYPNARERLFKSLKDNPNE